MPRVVRAFVLFLFVLCEPAWAVDDAKIPDLVAQVEALFEQGRDWADVKFRADGISDPSQDNLAARMEMDRLKSESALFL